MSKANDASKRELTEAELEDVSGGFDPSKNEVAVEAVTKVTKMEWGPVSFDIGLG